MCGVQNCPLSFRETLALRQIVDELTEGDAENSLAVKMDVGRLLYDVSVAIGLDPWSVLNPAIMNRLEDEGKVRLWPTLTRSEEDELAETDAIREGPTGRDTGMKEGASCPDDYIASFITYIISQG